MSKHRGGVEVRCIPGNDGSAERSGGRLIALSPALPVVTLLFYRKAGYWFRLWPLAALTVGVYRRGQLDPLGRECGKGERCEYVVSEFGGRHRIETGGLRGRGEWPGIAPASHRQQMMQRLYLAAGMPAAASPLDQAANAVDFTFAVRFSPSRMLGLSASSIGREDRGNCTMSSERPKDST